MADHAQSQELVPASNGVLPTAEDFAQAREALEALVERGDAEEIFEGSICAGAARLYHERNRHTQTANQYARLKILAEAGLGILDIRVSQPGKRMKEPYRIGDEVIPLSRAREWRTFGVAHMRGMLDPLLDRLEADPDETLSTHKVMRACTEKGVLWASIEPLREAFDRSSLSLTEVARRVGHGHAAVSHMLSRGKRQDGYHRWDTVAPICEVLGYNPRDLPSDARPDKMRIRQAHAAKERARMARQALADQRREQAIKQAVRKAGGAISDLYAMAERMQDVLAYAQREATDREAREALSLAGEHHRKMRDEIVRALGVS